MLLCVSLFAECITWTCVFTSGVVIIAIIQTGKLSLSEGAVAPGGRLGEGGRAGIHVSALWFSSSCFQVSHFAASLTCQLWELALSLSSKIN